VPDETLTRIRDWLTSADITFREVRHEPTRTSEDSARARGEDLRVGGKAIVLKVDKTFRVFVLSAACKLDSAAIKKHFNARKLRFATADELDGTTGLPPGAVPPFGHPILPFDLFVDESVLQNEVIAFNAGSLTTSIIMLTGDYLAIANPTIFAFSN
jgi:prolyl-tRNA editing enzyme YbaK/EbsC (Cys-tRNA(Pro) deacylase)